MRELPKTYAPQEVEDKWYQYWESNGLFHAVVNKKKKPYTVVIPPPNITGILTMGHVLNNTLQDAFIRWRRMQGYEACWIPGTDHAGIATQNVVERSLLKEGIKRRELGREEFVNRVWQWKEIYGSTIIKQLRKLGTSCDWQRERFTMDEGLSNAVKEVFVRLYEKGLIYKGKYIVNWCPRDHTALSDDEVNYTESNGHLWYIKYPLEDKSGFVTVATTRPETMLGDTAVAVNPKDNRYKHLAGKKISLPLTDRVIPIIADEFVDASFGTGAVKVTPAHDPNDFQIGNRHNLEKLIVMDTSGMMNDRVPSKYKGLDRYECRREVLRDLEKSGLLEKTEDHVHSVGHCYRCDTVIEPYLSDQWFVKMKPLAEPALRVVEDGKIKFYPDRWMKVYEHWMTNIRDWCISRQLWWGHRIPAWYCVGDDHCTLECKQPIVARTKPEACPHCGSTNLRQDDDVLDTWFSSWLWPLSVLNWPEENDELKYFYPTETLVTAPDIIFFWVARMVMAGLEFRNEIPFRHVYFTSIIRDVQGRKMSKSLGNSPDPLDVINTYGADALRFTILYLAPIGQDVMYSNEKCEMGRNFANKIWNAGRFLLMNYDAIAASGPNESQNHIAAGATSGFEIVSLHASNDLSDRWIISRFNETVKNVTSMMENFRINDAVKLLYDFLWHDFCDWYVEFVKNRIAETSDGHLKKAMINRAIRIYEETLKLLHPFMPFVTEEIWQHLAERKPGESIMTAPWPRHDEAAIDSVADKEMAFLQNVISSVRTIRNEMNVPTTKEVDVVINCNDGGKITVLETNLSIFKRLAKLETVQIGTNFKKPGFSASAVVEGQEVFVPLQGLIDIEVERGRLEKEIARFEGQLKSVDAKLNNANFADKAPAEIIQKEKDKRENFQQTLQKLRTNLEQLTA
ncbi:MAG: valine--tRNA ligase [Bacteroidota bacterium]|nr:valine--tRNA ligase [Bacteroidota bacterium]